MQTHSSLDPISNLKYGLELPTYGDSASPRTLAALARLAERAGWDGVFLEDYIVHRDDAGRPEQVFDPWVTLAAMAMSTERVRVGTTVTPLARRRPWKVARESLTVDHLSNGRLTLGVGLGDMAHQGKSFSCFGEVIDARERARMVDEGLEILVGLWSGKPFSFDGFYYKINEVTFLPVPVQKPRIPIWVGGNWPTPGPINRAAQWDGFVGGKAHGKGEPWCLKPEEVKSLKRTIESQRKASTGSPFQIALGGASRSDDWDADRQKIRSLASAGATWWMEYVPPDTEREMRSAIMRGPLRIGPLSLA